MFFSSFKLFVYNHQEGIKVRPNKKISVFNRVTRPYLNLLVKARFFLRFSGKKYFMHFEKIN